jgi:CSLREA domain-containing protein
MATSFAVNTFGDGQDANRGDGACATSDGRCTLRAAVEETNILAGLDSVSVPSGTYNVDLGPITITDQIDLSGSSAPTTLIQSGPSPQQRGETLFYINPPNRTRVLIARVTLRNAGGTNGGAIRVDNGALEFDQVAIRDCRATYVLTLSGLNARAYIPAPSLAELELAVEFTRISLPPS